MKSVFFSPRLVATPRLKNPVCFTKWLLLTLLLLLLLSMELCFLLLVVMLIREPSILKAAYSGRVV